MLMYMQFLSYSKSKYPFDLFTWLQLYYVLSPNLIQLACSLLTFITTSSRLPTILRIASIFRMSSSIHLAWRRATLQAWNFTIGQDYSVFVHVTQSSRMLEDIGVNIRQSLQHQYQMRQDGKRHTGLTSHYFISHRTRHVEDTCCVIGHFFGHHWCTSMHGALLYIAKLEQGHGLDWRWLHIHLPIERIWDGNSALESHFKQFWTRRWQWRLSLALSSWRPCSYFLLAFYCTFTSKTLANERATQME